MATQQAQKDTKDSLDPKIERLAGVTREAAQEAGAAREAALEDSKVAAKEMIDGAAGAASRTTEEMARTAREFTSAFASSYGVFADGIQELQHGYWRIVQQSVDVATSTPVEMMRCRSFTELSKLQRETVQRYLDGLVDVNRTLLDVSARVVERASSPLHEHARRA
jgi:hypothetical protein